MHAVTHNTSQSKTMLYSALIQSNTSFQTFHGLPMFEGMSRHHAMTLFSCMKEETFQEHEVIYSAGTETVGKMYLIMHGRVRIADTSGHHYGTLQHGDVFGLFSFLDDSRQHSATVQAASELTVLTMERSLFNLIDAEDPKLAQHMMRFMFRLLSQKALKMETEYANMHQFALGRKV